MEVICLEDAALYTMIEQVVERLSHAHDDKKDNWISDEEAMHLLNIKSHTTLQKLRDEGKIRFSQPQKRVILYDRNSIHDYLDKNAHNTF
jgi:hypothetical protein